MIILVNLIKKITNNIFLFLNTLSFSLFYIIFKTFKCNINFKLIILNEKLNIGII